MITLDGEPLPWEAGMTLADLLKTVAEAHHYAVIKVNGRYVSRPNFETFIVPDNASVLLIPMIAGG